MPTKPTPPTSPPPITPSPVTPPNKKGMSTGGKVAIGLGCGCLILLLIGAIIGYFVYKQASKKVKEELNNYSPQKLEESLTDLSGIDEFDKTIKEIEDGVSKSTSKTGKMNEALTDGEVEMTVNSTKKLTSIEHNTLADGHEYIVVNMKLKNKTKKEITVFTSSFFLRDGDFNKYYTAYLEEGSLSNLISAWQYIPSDKEITGDIVFEVKKDAVGLGVIYDGEVELQFKLEE